MAFGFLSSIIPDVDKNVNLYASPANILTKGKVSISSKVTNPVRIRLAIRESTGGHSDLRYLEYNKYISYGEVYETGEINLGPNQTLVVRSDHSDVSFLFTGESIDETNANFGTNVNSGLFGHIISTDTNKKVLYHVPIDPGKTNLQAEVTIVICNLGTMPKRARIGLVQESENVTDFQVEDYIEYEVVVPPSQTYIRPGVKLIAGERILVSSSNDSNLQFLAHGRLSFPPNPNQITTENINASGIVTATTFDGNVTGNVTGNADSATTASTATNALNLNSQDPSYYLNYNNLSNTPTIPTSNSELTNGAGFITNNVSGITTFNGAVGFGTTSGFPHTAKLNFGDNQEASLSVSSQFNTFVVDNKGTGDTVIRAEKIELDAFSSPGSGAQTALIVDHTGAKGTHVQLYNDSDLRLETTSTGVQVSGILDTGEINYNSGTLKLSTSDTERVSVKPNGTVIFQAGVAEQLNNVGGTMTSNSTQLIQLGNVIRFSGNESGATTLNITGITTTITSNEAISFTVICTPNSSGYISGVQIDGVSPATSLVWSGGAPTTGSASGRDVYTFSVLRTGSATNAYEIYGSRNNYT